MSITVITVMGFMLELQTTIFGIWEKLRSSGGWVKCVRWKCLQRFLTCNPGLVWTSRSSYNGLLQPTRPTCPCSLWMTAQASFKTDWNILYCITLGKSLLKQYLSSLPYTVYHCFFKRHMESRNPCCAQMPWTLLILHVPPRLLLLTRTCAVLYSHSPT